MTNIKYLEQSLPVAPLKIASLESCKGLGEKVNNHIVNFRKEAQTEILNSPLFANYHSDNFLIDCKCPRFGSGEADVYKRQVQYHPYRNSGRACRCGAGSD